MANALATTCFLQTKSVTDYSLHLFRQAFTTLLRALDAAIAAERELELATDGQPGSVFDPSISGYLKHAEQAWDSVTDALITVTTTSSDTHEGVSLRDLARCLKEVLASETPEEFDQTMAIASRILATTVARADMSTAEKDFCHLAKSAASRFSALETLNIYQH